MTPKSLMSLLVFTGLFGFVIQLLPGFDSGGILLLLLGGVVGIVDSNSRRFDEREEQLLSQAYGTTFQWSLLVLMIVYAFSELSSWLGLLSPIRLFLDAHWLGLSFSTICLLLGIAGFRRFQEIRP
ncbi:MAG: hypothetical protein H6671_11595 [Anaerolineaceae bacterium]|nr:hypothetical protein [Anaerolineaceae bacterium]